MEQLGPYRLVRLLARGGMGEVYLATLRREGGFEKRVAVKRMLPRLCGQPAFVELFEREARLAASLEHRHLVQVFDFGRQADVAWLAMEFVHGADLQTVLEACRTRSERLPAGLALEIGLACCRALEHVHAAADPAGLPPGLVHRDVSPQNVLLSFGGDVKLVDFGLTGSPAGDECGGEGWIQGKVAYMSPEQAEGQPLDARSDLFSLGVLLYEALSGLRAFHAADGREAILTRVRRAELLVPPSALPAAVLPRPLVPVLEALLARHRADRPADAGVVARLLLQAAQRAGIPVGEPALGPWLAAHFPDRLALGSAERGGLLPTPGPVEATEAAAAPISPVVPRPVLREGAPVARRRLALLASLLAAALLGLGGLLLGPGATRPVAPAGAPALVPATDPVAPAEARTGASTPTAATASVAAPESPARQVTAASGAVSRRDRARTAHPLSGSPGGLPPRESPPREPSPSPPGPSASADAPLPTIQDPPRSGPAPAAQPSPASRPGTPPRATGPQVDATPPPEPRVRLSARPGRILVRGAEITGWQGLPASGLLFEVADGEGPPVRLRLHARSGLVRANLDARPWGQVTLDQRSLGETPIAGLPLLPGAHRLEVAAAGGGTTRLVLEVGQ